MATLIYKHNRLVWRDDGAVFRENGPCEIHNTGEVFFSQIDASSYNRRSNGPSIIHSSGYIRFHDEEGYTSRLNGPAIVHLDGTKAYYINGNEASADEVFLKYGVI